MPDFGLIAIIVFCGLAVLFSVGAIASYAEGKKWNHGRCKECNDSWQSFDTDSQGGRGYKCGCGRHIWISYRVDRKRAA